MEIKAKRSVRYIKEWTKDTEYAELNRLPWTIHVPFPRQSLFGCRKTSTKHLVDDFPDHSSQLY